jgi:hypothetical protein
MGESQKDMIIKSIQMLCNMFPYNVFYKESLKKAEAIELHHSKTASAIGGHEPVQLLFYEIQDTPYLELVKKIVSNILKEARDFSCITAPLPWDAAEEIRQWGLKNIPDEDLINDGRESEVHVTVLYGLHGHDPYEIRPIIDGFGPVKLTLGEISIFENEDQDVVKISVDSPDLVRLNKLIADKFEYTKTHPKYIPHVTLAYLKPGLGKKYVGRKDFAGKEITISEILFSGNDYRETTFPL